MLYRHIVSAAFQLSVSWKPGMIAMWDERCTLHTVVADYHERRVMWRAYIAQS
jgi:taurine dioxygenase